jgi:hypothetical protein
MVIDLTDSHSRIVHRPRPEDDPKQCQPDISRAEDLLNWKPRTMLKDGLVNTIAYFDRLLSDQKLRAQLVRSPVEPRAEPTHHCHRLRGTKARDEGNALMNRRRSPARSWHPSPAGIRHIVIPKR